jgi:hypothetical protein
MNHVSKCEIVFCCQGLKESFLGAAKSFTRGRQLEASRIILQRSLLAKIVAQFLPSRRCPFATMRGMDEAAFDDACRQLSREIQNERLYGSGYDDGKDVWDWPCQGVQIAWGLITRGCNREILRKRLGMARSPDWNKIYAEAYRQSVLRSQLTDLSDGE